MKVESDYRADTIGAAGEIGLMQVRPSTARLLGFMGSVRELADPAINIRLGVTYLAKAWRLAQGDSCRALMKACIFNQCGLTLCDHADFTPIKWARMTMYALG